MSKVEFNIYEDLEKVNANSLLIESGIEIASLQVDNIYLSLMCYGEVNINYKGNIYKRPCDYPQEIVDYLLGKTETIDESFSVSDNNWFQIEMYVVSNRKDCVLVSIDNINNYLDTFDIEGELTDENLSLSEKLYKIMLDYFKELKEEYGNDITELKKLSLKNL